MSATADRSRGARQHHADGQLNVVPRVQSCGVCRTLMQRYNVLCAESAAQRAGLRFLKHNVRNEFDDPSDVARMFRVRATPCFVFLDGGAKVGSKFRKFKAPLCGWSLAQLAGQLVPLCPSPTCRTEVLLRHSHGNVAARVPVHAALHGSLADKA